MNSRIECFLPRRQFHLRSAGNDQSQFCHRVQRIKAGANRAGQQRICQCQLVSATRRQAIVAIVSIGASCLNVAASTAKGEQQAAASSPAQQEQQAAAGEAQPAPDVKSKVPLAAEELSDEATKKLLEEEEERRRARRRKRGRIRELEETRAELAEKELVLLEKEQELLMQEQTVMVLKEELELERKLRTLLTKEKEKAEEEAALAMGLCATGGSMLP